MFQSALKSRQWLAITVVIAALLIAAMVWGVNHVAGAPPVLADDEKIFFAFVAIAEADPTDGVVPRIGTSGIGVFDPEDGKVEGGGTFEMFDFGASRVPKPRLRSAKWEAKRVLDWRPCTTPGACTGSDATYGRINPGVIELEVNIKFDGGKKIKGLTMTLICKVGAAGITPVDPATGDLLPEGFFLTIPDPDFGMLEFVPLDPTVGITHIGPDPGFNFDLKKGKKRD